MCGKDHRPLTEQDIKEGEERAQRLEYQRSLQSEIYEGEWFIRMFGEEGEELYFRELNYEDGNWTENIKDATSWPTEKEAENIRAWLLRETDISEPLTLKYLPVG